MTTVDESLAPGLRSWVGSANDGDTDFPVQNLPLGVFRRSATDERPRAGVAIGDGILDIPAAAGLGLFDGECAPAAAACSEPSLNRLMSLGREAAAALRRRASVVLRDDTEEGRRAMLLASTLLVPMRDAIMSLPAAVGDYTDFYSSLYHATNVGSMFRPDSPLLPNYKYVPIGYHGRASSLVVSGTSVRRPRGQTRNDPAGPVAFGATTRLDYELEVGAFIGTGNALGEPVPITEAERHLFGLCLLNDWSARDIQAWEYQPLGPFLAKNFATTVSPWVVTLEALAPFRIAAFRRPDGDPPPATYLSSSEDQSHGGFDIVLEVWLSSARMRESRVPSLRVSRGHFAEMYWTVAQLLTHHASGGCNLRPGDLLASGTVSGPTPDSRGCLLERAWRGTQPLTLPTGEERRFLEDGDEVILRGSCQRDGFARIGFGECRGQISPATIA